MMIKGRSASAIIFKLILTSVVLVGLNYMHESHCFATLGDKLQIYHYCYHLIIGYGLIYYGLTLIGSLIAKLF